MEKQHKNYWRPLWSGLVLDEQAKHYRRMKNSVWLFLYLILKSGRTGFLRKTCNEISKETGIKSRTIRNWLKNLKNKGYVSVKKQSKGILIHINCPNGHVRAMFIHTTCPIGQKNQGSAPVSNSDNLEKTCQSEKNKVEKTLYSSGKNEKTSLCNKYDTNNKYIYNDVNIFNNDYNNDMENNNKNELNSFYLTREELLAKKLAEGLDDFESLKFYLSATRKFPEELLIKIYREVKSIPSYKIKKSRGALFNYLLQKYEQNNSFD